MNANPPAGARTLVAYVACADSREIQVLRIDEASGTLQPLQAVPTSGAVMPLALRPDHRVLYASLRTEPFAVAAFAIDRASGQLAPLGQAPLPESSAYIATDRSGRWLFAASYHQHRFSISPLAADGTPGAATQVLDTGRHAHAAVPAADNRFVFVPTLGADQVMQWRFDAATGRATPNEPPALASPAGAGPRHLVLAPNGRHAYLLNELDATVALLDLDRARGTLAWRAAWSTLPPGFAGGAPWGADLHLTPDGRFLYTSERRSNTLAAWRVDVASGELSLVGHVGTEDQPRGFNLDPTGRWLLAAGQASHAVALYRIDAETGALTLSQRLPLGRNPNWVEILDLNAIAP
jgi:6-phosphogluconolactonase